MRLTHTFSNGALLEQALTHPSFSHLHGNVPHNQRLEFLGDAVVGMIATDLLFREFPGWDEGALSRGRSALVKTETFASIAEELGIVEVLRVERGGLGSGRKVLADAFEAVVGAVWLDGHAQAGEGCAWEAVRAFVEPLLLPRVRALPREAPPRDPVSTLQVRAQASGKGTPSYEVVAIEGRPPDEIFRVRVHVAGGTYGPAEGRSKRTAAAAAAAMALVALDAAEGEAPARPPR